jgi:hypothetical protein
MRDQKRCPIILSAIALCLAIACVSPTFSFAGDQDHAELVKVAALPGLFAGRWPCGDGNHNGRYDIYGTSGHLLQRPDTMLVCEDTWRDSYRYIWTGVPTGRILDIGDGDRDGLCDIITSPTDLDLHVWEAVAPDSFPSREVWSDSPPCYVSYAKWCDLDRDGRKEIVVCGRQSIGVYVYENRGDNQYVEVPFPRGFYDIQSTFAVGDFDSDSLTELVGGNWDGHLLVYECTGEDQYARVCSLYYYVPFHEEESYNHAAANDMDRDGHPEFISLFQIEASDSCRVRIFEEPVHNQFACVCSLALRSNPFAGAGVATGDVDGDGTDEFSISTGIDVRLFRGVGPDQYEQTWQLDWYGVRWMRFFDINQDRRDELIISCADSTYIFEDTSGLGAAETPKPQPWVRAIAVEPTVSRRGWPAIFTGIPDGATVEVHDMAGRLVRTQLLKAGPSWTWNLRDQAGNPVPAGTYFAVVRSKGKATSLKLCVVK